MLRRLRDYVDVYLVTARTSIIQQFQYRLANLLWMIGMFAEPVIYLVVWSTIAEEQGGSVGGYTASAFAAYYITWTMVRHFNIGLTPYAFEFRIKDGQLSGQLLRPIHPYHFDLGFFLGWKIPTTIYWIPIGIALTLIFRPELNPAPWQIAAFCVALVTGFIMRFTLLWVLGLITFWTTRVSAIFDVYFTLELLLSGRLVPLSLMPVWAQGAADWLPFQWAFAFPIELLLGRLTPQEVWMGFGAQAIWFTIGAILLAWVWRHGVRKYSAVGG